MSDPAPPVDPPQPEPKQFDEAYVQKLREENKARRLEASEAKERTDKATSLALDLSVKAHATALRDPTDLLAFYPASELLGEDGLPSSELIVEKTRELLESKPHLDAALPDGDIDQGSRGTPPATRDFSGMLREAAG